MARYGPYESNSGHLFWVDKDGDTLRSVWVHREVMEGVLGRPLTDDEIVHHKDENKQNNAPENLEVMTRAEHNKLHHEPPEMAEVTCPECSRCVLKFARDVRSNLKKGRAGPFCGRVCAGKRNARIRYGQIPELV